MTAGSSNADSKRDAAEDAIVREKGGGGAKRKTRMALESNFLLVIGDGVHGHYIDTTDWTTSGLEDPHDH